MMRIYELARQLGWSPKQLMQVLNQRGEYVSSPMNKLEAPVVRAILREFASQADTPTATDAHTVLDPTMFGHSAATTALGATGTSFAAESLESDLRRRPANALPGARGKWLPPILRALLDEIIVPNRREGLGPPTDGRPCYPWEMTKARALQKEWGSPTKQLLRLIGSDETIVEWIRLTEDGQRPNVATDLALSGITPTRSSTTAELRPLS